MPTSVPPTETLPVVERISSPEEADERHRRYCEMCGGKFDATAFINEVYAQLQGSRPKPSLKQLVTGAGPRRPRRDASQPVPATSTAPLPLSSP